MSIRLEHVCYQFKNATDEHDFALKDINLTIEDGEFVGIIGKTGSGKSTLMQHLNGLEKATSGTVYFNGENIYEEGYDKKALRGKVGLVFQYPEYQLFESTVLEDVKFGPRNLGLPNLEVDLRSFKAIKDVGLTEDDLDLSPFQLSGGQKRRVAIAGVLAMEPEVLILDEPTAGLDPAGREEMFELIRRIRKERKCTVILVSHSMDDVANYVERLLVMHEGRIVLDGTPIDIFQHPTELAAIGLSVPQVTSVLWKLKEKGIDIQTDAIHVEDAKKKILEAYWNQSRG